MGKIMEIKVDQSIVNANACDALVSEWVINPQETIDLLQADGLKRITFMQQLSEKQKKFEATKTKGLALFSDIQSLNEYVAKLKEIPNKSLQYDYSIQQPTALTYKRDPPPEKINPQSLLTVEIVILLEEKRIELLSKDYDALQGLDKINHWGDKPVGEPSQSTVKNLVADVQKFAANEGKYSLQLIPSSPFEAGHHMLFWKAQNGSGLLDPDSAVEIYDSASEVAEKLKAIVTSSQKFSENTITVIQKIG